MQKVSCHCTLYLRLVCDMLCPFHWNADHRDVPSIYNQGTNRLWFLYDCYFRQLLYKPRSVLLENSGDKKSYKEHSKGVGWETEWIINTPTLASQNDFLDANMREQGWGWVWEAMLAHYWEHSPPMWPRFKSRRRRHLWVHCVVGSLHCTESLFTEWSGIPYAQIQNFQIPFDLERTVGKEIGDA